MTIERRMLYFGVSAILLAATCVSNASGQDTNAGHLKAKRNTFQNLEARVQKLVAGQPLKYLLHIPAGVLPEGRKTNAKKFPMVLFLHGGGEGGNNLDAVKKHGLPKLIAAGRQFPFFVVAPQNPSKTQFWDDQKLIQLIDELVADHPIDSSRIYLTGLSRGGYGAWRLAIQNPNRFAAVLPISGGGPLPYVKRLKDVPIWIFHGEQDPVIPVGESQRLNEALLQAGGNVKLTTYADAQHDAWTQTYDNPEIYDWMLNQKRDAQTMVFPEAEWAHGTPESQGIDAAKLELALEFLASHCKDDGLSELMLIRNGVCIYEGENTKKVHNIWSCSKSFTSTALGLLIADGMCDLGTKACSIDESLKPLYPNATLRHFATMSSGFSAQGRSRWNDENSDWSKTPYLPDTPHFEPGTAFAYWDEAQMMLGRLLTRVAKRTLRDYLQERVFDPINMGKVKWGIEGEIDGIPICNGCTNVEINAQQFARFGHLYLNRGNWNGQQLIPAEWVDAATSVQVPVTIPVGDTDRKNVKGSGSYGFNWWVNGGLTPLPDAPPKTYYASGLNHNVCVVVPEWNLVIVRMGVDGNPEFGKHNVYNGFLKKLRAALAE